MRKSRSEGAPNIVLIMADQMAAPALPMYGHKTVKTPHLLSLAETGVVFENAYCNFPICAPSRYSLLTGRLANSIDIFDNACEFPAGVPTLAHYLSELGYRTTLCGKMHFIGPDQLHGYEERLVTDIYPANFIWTPNWLEGESNSPTGISLKAVVEAGKCIRSLQIDYDDEVEYYGIQKIYDLARAPGERPFFLTVSFTHPHSPFTASAEHWDRYNRSDIDMPSVPAIPLEKLDAHSRWLYFSHGRDRYPMTEQHILDARHAYYGMISYVDDKVGKILKALKETKLDENTIIVFTADHGEMLGERGMWFKQTFYEWSSRVPLIIASPGRIPSRRESAVVSLVDLTPTLLHLATMGNLPEIADPFEGRSLAKLMLGGDDEWPDKATSEYTDMGVCAPCRMVRRGRYKYIHTTGHPAQLFDLNTDPQELTNLSGMPAYASIETELLTETLRGWDPDDVHRRVLESQKRRRFIQRAAARSGRYPNWAYRLRPGDENRFVRGGGASNGVVDTKARARLPFVSAERVLLSDGSSPHDDLPW